MCTPSRIALAALLALTLAGCGGGGDGAAAPTPAPTAPVTPPPVTPAPPPAITVSFDKTSVAVTAASSTDAPQSTVTMTVSSLPDSGLWVGRSFSTTGVSAVDFASAGTSATLTIKFKSAAQLGPGTYTDTLNVRVCSDSGCSVVVGNGSIAITYTVSALFVGAPPEVLSRAALTHDVVDAEVSVALNAIVMVSAIPRNSLYVYDLAAGTERELALGKTPRSVSVSLDGLTAAVGHDALITHVALQTVGQPTPDVKLLNVAADLGDVVLVNGYVYGLPRVDQWVDMHSVDIATNTETTSYGLRANSFGRAVASGQFLYDANTGLSPSDFEKWDLRSGKAVRVADSPYHGDYPICGNIWPSEDGTRLYTPCGATFRATTDPATDMTYAGTFDLTRSGMSPTMVTALSHSAEKKEIMIVDAAPASYGSTCGTTNLYDSDCLSRLRFYESDFLQLQADFTLPPLTIGDAKYPQRGVFVFHDGSGDGRFVISQAVAAPNASASFFLTKVKRSP